jgi:hypothetical protein
MAPKLAGHALQLLGYALVFLGLAAAAVLLFASGRYPAAPMWAFVSGAVVCGAPMMIAGGRINSVGRGLVLGMSPGRAARQYRVQTVLMALYLGFLWLLGGLAAAPVFVRATGLAYPSDTFFSVWLAAWVLIFCGGRPWVTRPLWRAIERRALARMGEPRIDRGLGRAAALGCGKSDSV